MGPRGSTRVVKRSQESILIQEPSGRAASPELLCLLGEGAPLPWQTCSSFTGGNRFCWCLRMFYSSCRTLLRDGRSYEMILRRRWDLSCFQWHWQGFVSQILRGGLSRRSEMCDHLSSPTPLPKAPPGSSGRASLSGWSHREPRTCSTPRAQVRCCQASIAFPLARGPCCLEYFSVQDPSAERMGRGRSGLLPANTRSWARLSARTQHTFSPQQCVVLHMITINNGASITIVVQSLSRVRFLATPGTVARQAPLSMGFPRQEYWSGLPFPPPADLPRDQTYVSYLGRWVLYHWASPLGIHHDRGTMFSSL